MNQSLSKLLKYCDTRGNRTSIIPNHRLSVEAHPKRIILTINARKSNY